MRKGQEGAAHRMRAQAEPSAAYQQLAQRAQLLEERQVVEAEESCSPAGNRRPTASRSIGAAAESARGAGRTLEIGSVTAD